jgi:hypothetical protein
VHLKPCAVFALRGRTSGRGCTVLDFSEQLAMLDDPAAVLGDGSVRNNALGNAARHLRGRIGRHAAPPPRSCTSMPRANQVLEETRGA